MIQEKDRLTGEPTGLMIPMLKEYKVFNISQTTLELEKLKIEPIIKEEPEKIIDGYKNSEYLNRQYSLQSLLDRELGEVNSDINLLKRISKPSPPTLEDLLHYYS
jgi:hypothetical protein